MDDAVSDVRLSQFRDMSQRRDEYLAKAIRKLDGWSGVQLSYSAWSSYRQCPLKGVLGSTRVVKPAEMPPISVANFRGQVVHKVFDLVLEQSRRDPKVLLSAEAFVDAIPVAWGIVNKECGAQVAWESDAQPDSVSADLKCIIDQSYLLMREVPGDGLRILKLAYENKFYTEKRFRMKLDSAITLIGRIDLQIVTPELVLAVDYKDGKKENTSWKQLAFYMAEQLEAGSPCRGGFLFTSLGEWAWKNIDTLRWACLKEEIREVVALIESREFPAVVGRLCGYCDFSAVCPEYFLKGGLTKQLENELSAMPDGENQW